METCRIPDPSGCYRTVDLNHGKLLYDFYCIYCVSFPSALGPSFVLNLKADEPRGVEKGSGRSASLQDLQLYHIHAHIYIYTLDISLILPTFSFISLARSEQHQTC